MAATFNDIFKNLLSGQILVRIFSFLFNFILLRITDPSTLGFFNVRMNLFYNTIGFLSREPIRKLCLGSEIPADSVNRYAVLSPVISILVTIFCTFVWFLTWKPTNELAIDITAYFMVLSAYSISIFLEITVEPFIINELKSGKTSNYVRNNTILVFAQKFLAFLTLILGFNPFIAFTLSQVSASFLYVYISIIPRPCLLIETYKHAISDAFHSGFNQEQINLLKTILFHSFLKQFLTDGANFMMTFTDFIPLKLQAVYDAIDRLGSLVVRLFLQPLEESAAIYFSIHLKRGNYDVPTEIIHTFLLLIRFILSFGLVILVFGSSYATIAASIYGGTTFIENKADNLLFWYSLYLPVIAVNGLSECFIMAILNKEQLKIHAIFFIFSVVAHLAFNYIFCQLLGTEGFIIANIINYLGRTCFNWWFIRPILGSKFVQSIEKKLMPSKLFIFVHLLSWIILLVAKSIGSSIIHIFIGIIMLAATAYIFYKNDYIYYKDMKLKRT